MRRGTMIAACLVAFGLGGAAGEKESDAPPAASETPASPEAAPRVPASAAPPVAGRQAPGPPQRPLERLKTPPLAPDANIPLPQDI